LSKRNHRQALCLSPAVIPMLAISSDECVRALMLAGFCVSERRRGRTVLECGYRRVEVPHAMVLTHPALEGVLRAAGVAATDFLDLLSRAFPPEGSAATETGVRRARTTKETG
jgi:hypothetical protein